MYSSTPKGIVFFVKVIPKASKSEILDWEEDALKIRLKALPAKGEANEELIRFLAKTLKLRQSQIEILSGATARRKKLLVKEIDLSTLEEKLP